jgi:hypothetical protein
VSICNEERENRHFTVQNAIATNRLEGLSVDPETVVELDAWANGEMTLDEAKARCLARISQRAAGRKAED